MGTVIAAGALLAWPATAAAQNVMDLDVGDPARRDQKVAVVLDGIVNSHTAESLTPDALAARLADVRLLLIGESHDSMEAHRVQLAVIKELVAAGREVVIGLEMYPYTEQPFLDQWVGGMLTEKGFVELSRWYHNWGFNWGYYRDVLMFARDRRVPVVAVNTPRSVVSAVRQKGFSGLTEEEAYDVRHPTVEPLTLEPVAVVMHVHSQDVTVHHSENQQVVGGDGVPTHCTRDEEQQRGTQRCGDSQSNHQAGAQQVAGVLESSQQELVEDRGGHPALVLQVGWMREKRISVSVGGTHEWVSAWA